MDKSKFLYSSQLYDASIFNKQAKLSFLFDEETSSFLMEKESANVFFIEGAQGSGKTLFLENLAKRFSKDDNFLYIPFFKNITLDDIYLQLYYQIENSAQAFILKKNASDPIDIRIINILKDKSIKKIVALDNVDEVDTKILNFIKFLSEKAQNVLLIMAGRNTSEEIEDFIDKQITLKPLNSAKIVKLLNLYNVEFSNKIISQLLDITTVYTADIFKLIALVQTKGVKLFDIVMKFSSKKDSLDYFLEKELNITYINYINSLGVLSQINFPINKINLIDIFDEISTDEIDKLISLQVIKNDFNFLSICEDLKEAIQKSINKERFAQNVLNTFENQASLGIKDRKLYVSRGTINKIIEEYSDFLNITKTKKIESKLKKTRKTKKSDYAYLNTNNDISADELDDLMISDFEKDLLEDKDFNLEEEIQEQPKDKSNVDIEILINKAFDYEKKKQYKKSIECLEQALEQAEYDKNNHKIIFILNKISNIYSRMGDYENCIKTLKDSYNVASTIEEKEKKYLIKFHMGKCYKKFFKYDEAKKAYLEFIRSDIKNEDFKAEARLSMANILYESKDYKEALSLYKQVIQTPTKIRNKAEALFYSALIFDEQDEIKDALISYQKCIELSDDVYENRFLAPSYGNIGNILYETSHNTNAIVFFEKSLEVDIESNNTEGQYFTFSKLGNIMYEDKNFKKALIYFKKKLKNALKLDKSYHIAESYMDIGDTFLKLSEYLKAKKCYILAKKCVDDNISVESIQKIDKRLAHIEKALKK